MVEAGAVSGAADATAAYFLTKLDTTGVVDRVRTNTHCLGLDELANPDDDTPDLAERGRETDQSLFNQPPDADCPRESENCFVGGRLCGSAVIACRDRGADRVRPFRRSDGGTAGASVRYHRWRLEAASSTDRISGTERRSYRGNVQGGLTEDNRHNWLGTVDLSGLRGAFRPRRYRPGRVADVFRFLGACRDAGSAGHPRPDR